MTNNTSPNRAELLKLVEQTEALKEKVKFNQLDFIMPPSGKYSRDKYPKALEFFAAGKNHHNRMLAGGNGVGKSFTGALELVYHATGLYPDWWEGHRIDRPKLIWIVSESGSTFKDSLQRLLLGPTLNEGDLGTGLIPKDRIGKLAGWPSLTGAVMSIEVLHKKGHTVTVTVKTSDQKRENLQAANVDVVVFDEEPPEDIYTECMIRLRETSIKPLGISMLLFTPLKGLTEVVLKYLDQGQYPRNGQHPKDPQKYIVRVEMDDVPHITEATKQLYLQNTPPNQLEARTKGFPALGSGKIYPYLESQVFVRPFQIPDYWPRCFSLDFGHHVTACLWGAKDPHTNCLYIYAEYYSEGHQTVQVHALNIKSKGEWIDGICDPSGGGRQNDGRLLQELFEAQGLSLTPGDNSFISGIARNCNMFENGSLKIFDTLEKTKEEFRLYRYDSKNPNEPARNQKDHAMDCLKYLTSRFDYVAKADNDFEPVQRYSRHSGFDDISGY